jgi:hypothetical protein
MKFLLLLLCLSAQAQVHIKYWSGGHERADLAVFAMQAWAKASSGSLTVERVTNIDDAEIRFRWVEPRRRGLYGQSIATEQNGKPVAEIIINPSFESLGPDMSVTAAKDPLFGEVILFLTCVHEAGHALGPEHTRDFADIMYSFEYGGDFLAYFQRYRARLKSRADMQSNSPLSSGDVKQIQAWMRRRMHNGSR